MERLENEYLNSEEILRSEHRHRYMWAAQYAKGNVCDLACGYGYGADILIAKAEITSYAGFDSSAEAIQQATKRFSGDKKKYMIADASQIPLDNCTMDTVISMETLEHIAEPETAILEFKRILRPNGILLGSVPSKYFDDKAERVYGKNPHHITRFTLQRITDLLKHHFDHVRIYYSALEIVTHIGTLENGSPSQEENAIVDRDNLDGEVNGSYHFVATNQDGGNIDLIHHNRIFCASSLTDFDASKVIPLKKLVDHTDVLVHERDKYIKNLEERTEKMQGHIDQLQCNFDQCKETIQLQDETLASIPQSVIKIFKWAHKTLSRG